MCRAHLYGRSSEPWRPGARIPTVGTTALMWFRRDLRIHDLPALTDAASAQHTVPVFVFDERLHGDGARFSSPRRKAFMLACLRELDASLRERGGQLVVRHGSPEQEIPALAEEVGADSVHWTADCSPWARARDRRVIDALSRRGVRSHASPGAYVADDPSKVLTKQGRPYTVFSPYARSWLGLDRRAITRAPSSIELPSQLRAGRLPKASDIGADAGEQLAFDPGEAAGRRAAGRFLRSGIDAYDDRRDRPAGGSSLLSPYLRWGCVSALELDVKSARHGGEGAATYRNELAWRDFYAAVLVHFPGNVRREFQERYRDLEWKRPSRAFDRWREGTTGFPFVDAGMRQLASEGFMHNRLRMVVGSFLTKDLHLDWRLGEAHFMEQLLDGDMGSNNGGWQWIASVGTDPAPYFQRLFNPMTQQRRFDPDGTYVRRWVPELAQVPDEQLPEPWAMSERDQEAAGCVIGRDYPEPIVDHAEERRVAADRYRGAG